MKKMIIFLFLLIFVITACSPDSSGGGAAASAEAYIKALADKDKTAITNFSCLEWEESAILEVDALLSVEAEVSDLKCSEIEAIGDSTKVKCEGSLDLTYNDEIRAIDLSRRTYTLRQEDGTWRVCSYE